MAKTKKEWADAIRELINQAEADGIYIETATCCSCRTWVEVYEPHKHDERITMEI